jgi:hypothetical protein
MKFGAFISANILVAVMSVLALCLPMPAFAISTIAATPGGDGIFLIQGIGIENAAALEIIVSYDTAALANPRVVAGPLITGAMSEINPNVPGIVRMVIIRLTPVSGSGVIATMTFDRKSASPGSITSLVAKLADLKGSPIPAAASIAAPPAAAPASAASSPRTDSPAVSTASAPPASTGASAAPIVVPPAILVVPASPSSNVPDSPAVSRTAEQEPRPSSVPAETTPAQGDQLAMARSSDAPQKGKDAAAVSKAVYQQAGILERFLTYRGERTPAALVALFNNESMIGARQEPPVALSDGRSIVRFVFVSSPGTRTSSDIAVMGAKLLSLKRDPDNTNTWIVDLLPEKGAYQASVAVPLGELKMIYPLTIAPKVDIKAGRGKTLTMADFERYLKEKGKDLNKDGKRDDTDDFIFTANYLNAVGLTAARP